MTDVDLNAIEAPRWSAGHPDGGRVDVDGVEWFVCDPYPTWYRTEAGEITVGSPQFPADCVSEEPRLLDPDAFLRRAFDNLRAATDPWVYGVLSDDVPALVAALREQEATIARVRELATEWAEQLTDYYEDTDQQIADGRALLAALDPQEGQ